MGKVSSRRKISIQNIHCYKKNQVKIKVKMETIISRMTNPKTSPKKEERKVNFYVYF